MGHTRKHASPTTASPSTAAPTTPMELPPGPCSHCYAQDPAAPDLWRIRGDTSSGKVVDIALKMGRFPWPVPWFPRLAIGGPPRSRGGTHAGPCSLKNMRFGVHARPISACDPLTKAI
eukprot:gene8991-biopygen18176